MNEKFKKEFLDLINSIAEGTEKKKKTINIDIHISLFRIIFLIFLALKLTKAVTWSWLIVLSPLIIELIISVIFIIAFLIIMWIAAGDSDDRE